MLLTQEVLLLVVEAGTSGIALRGSGVLLKQPEEHRKLHIHFMGGQVTPLINLNGIRQVLMPMKLQHLRSP
jgi:hypothetical protein